LVIRPAILLSTVLCLAAWAQTPAPFHVNPDDLERIKARTASLEALVQVLKAKHADQDLTGDVEIYAKAGKILLEFPDQIFTQKHVDHALAILDSGIERANQLLDGKSPWTAGKKQIHAYYSTIDGSIQPYGVTLPDSYDPNKPTRLYVWLHGRGNQNTESEFLFSFPNSGPGRPPAADNGQIQVDVYGRLRSRRLRGHGRCTETLQNRR
jgi:hypothetical protein